MTKSKQDKIKRLLKLFVGEHRVYIDGSKAEKVRVSEAIGDRENQIVCMEWQEGNETFSVTITEAGLADAELRETAIELKDHEGEPVTLEFHSASEIVPMTTVFHDQSQITDPFQDLGSANGEDCQTSNRSVLLPAEQVREILCALKTVPDQAGVRKSISLLEELLADSEERCAYVAAAREKHAPDEGDVEVDEQAVVSMGSEGAYVQAWTWVPKEA